MRAARIVLTGIGVLAGFAAIVVAVAVAREQDALAGDALAQAPEAISYAAAQSKAVEAAGIRAKDRMLELRDPPMRTHISESGEGDAPIVFIHGGGATAAVWIPLLAELGSRHVVAVDRPGCGLTDGADYSETDLRKSAVAFVRGTLDALGLQRAVLVGNSMGGLFSIWFALEHPDRVAGIVLPGTPAVTLDTTAPRPMRMMSVPGIGQLMMMKAQNLDSMKERMASSLGQRAVDRLSPELLDAALLAGAIPGARRSFRTLIAAVLDTSGAKPGVGPGGEELARLVPPTLWIWGDADVFADAGFPSRVRAALPSAEVIVLQGAGHAPWIDEPKAVAQALGGFVDKLATPPASGR